MRVRCANCGMIWDYYVCPQILWVTDDLAQAMAEAHQTRCPKCGSNAFDLLGSSLHTILAPTTDATYRWDWKVTEESG